MKPRDSTLNELRDLAALAANRMEHCQTQLKRLDRLEAQARGEVDGVVWAELEGAKGYWLVEFRLAKEKNYRARVELETILVNKDKVDK